MATRESGAPLLRRLPRGLVIQIPSRAGGGRPRALGAPRDAARPPPALGSVAAPAPPAPVREAVRVAGVRGFRLAVAALRGRRIADEEADERRPRDAATEARHVVPRPPEAAWP